MKKVIHPCDVKMYDGRYYPLFCEITIEGGRLSISGVIGPTKSGNAEGGCGQVDMEFAHRNPDHDDRRYSNPVKPEDLRFAPGWDIEKWYDFLEAWHDWHLNDMKAGCEHQVGPEWTAKDVDIYHYTLTDSAYKAKKQAEQEALRALVGGEVFTPKPEQSLVASLPNSLTSHLPEAPEMYEPVKKTNWSRPVEVKSAGWLHENEHPEGFLAKACPVCGYKYGTEWRKQDLPESVIEFLSSLPDTDRTPNWV